MHEVTRDVFGAQQSESRPPARILRTLAQSLRSSRALRTPGLGKRVKRIRSDRGVRAGQPPGDRPSAGAIGWGATRA
jgi:hypothetical protein